MFLKAVCIAALVSLAYGDAVANAFVDSVLLQMRSSAVRAGLDPLRITPFNIKIKSNSITNADFKANFTQGSITGLSLITRAGECNYGSFGAEMKIGCYVTLGSIQILANVNVKGDKIGGSVHAISTGTKVSSNSYFLLEIRGRRGYPASLDKITLKPLTMTSSVIQGKVDLNQARFNEFVRQTHQNYASQLGLTLSGVYAHNINSVINGRTMP